ncbi:MAG: vWA domain-containing protein [Terrimicrobiaceae bacterium]
MKTSTSHAGGRNPAQKPNPFRGKRLLWTILLAVVGIHVLALVILGSVVVFRHIFERDVAFEAAPEVVKRIDPRKLEHKVKVQKQQQKSGRPKLQPRLSANKISDFTLPDIKSAVTPKLDPIKSSLQSFGASGIGTGTAGGKGLGGLGVGVSDVRFMGFNANTERVAVLLDLSPSMVEDQRGSFDGFDALKDEIKELVMRLNNGSLFNLIAFATGVDIYKPEAVRATDENKKDAVAWIDPYMGDRVNVEKNGTRLNNYRGKPETPKMESVGGKTRFDLAFAAAFESQVDTIFIVTDGVHFILKKETEAEIKERTERQSRVSPAELRRREDMKAEREVENKKRARRGIPPKVVESEGGPGPPRYEDKDVLEYIYSTAEALYKKNGMPMPKIYIIGYVTTPDDEVFLKELSREFRGRFRRSRTLSRPIR